MKDAFLDERPAKTKTLHEVGQDLSSLSVDELDARITVLKDEINRLEIEKTRKQAVKSAADTFFKAR